MVRIWGRINYFRICRQTDRAFQIKSEGKAYPFLLTILKPCGFQTFHCMDAALWAFWRIILAGQRSEAGRCNRDVLGKRNDLYFLAFRKLRSNWLKSYISQARYLTLLKEAVLRISPMSYKPTGMIVFCPIEIKPESKRRAGRHIISQQPIKGATNVILLTIGQHCFILCYHDSPRNENFWPESLYQLGTGLALMLIVRDILSLRGLVWRLWAKEANYRSPKATWIVSTIGAKT